MNLRAFASLGGAVALALLADIGHAHGGQYRGPADVVPPGMGRGGRGGGPAGSGPSGPAGPNTPGGAAPAAPGPAGPGTGGPAGPGGGRGPITGGGVQLEPDLTAWNIWWEFNKAPYLGLKDSLRQSTVSGSDVFYLGPTRHPEAIDLVAPTEQEKLQVILPALKKAIDSTDQRDITSSCMVALAKIGRNGDGFRLRDVFAPRLRGGDQEVCETAALAFGIAALPEQQDLELLVALATDAAAGREACRRSEVTDRTRAFACYAIGLLANANAADGIQRRALTALTGLLDDDRVTSRNVKVAAIQALSLLHVDGSADRPLLDAALASLDGYFAKDLGVGEQLLQAHVPTAVAKLLLRAGNTELTAAYKARYADELRAQAGERRRGNDIARSCAIALGLLCRPCEDDSAEDAAVCDLLLQQWHEHKDQQTRDFAMVALGRIGGQRNRTALLREFDKAGKSIGKPWVAMAMGVQAFTAYRCAEAAERPAVLEVEFGRALQQALRETKDPDALGAFSVALGLCRYQPAAFDLRAMLVKNRSKEELVGYLCIGLALMGERAAIEDIRDVAETSVRRPTQFLQSAIALGKLGDRGAATSLQQLVGDDETNLAKLSAVASALGYIGDRRTIAPLVRTVVDEARAPLARAFAAVALGGIADKEALPWNSKIGVDINYRAAVETLTDQATGILDIL